MGEIREMSLTNHALAEGSSKGGWANKSTFYNVLRGGGGCKKARWASVHDAQYSVFCPLPNNINETHYTLVE